MVAAEVGTIVEPEDVVLAFSPSRRRAHAEDELDAFIAEDFAEGFPQRRGLAGEQVLGALYDCNLTAQATDGLGHLDTHRASAEHHQPARNGLHACHLAVGPDAVELAQSGNRR